jgi:OOP family OmpA-OmpF porin
MSVIPTTGLFEGYEKTWYFADFWPGEYPPRFSVVSDDIELIGRTEMRLGAAKNIRCPVPKLATYSPWNNKRNEADQLLYKSVTQITAITFTGDVKVPAIRQSDDKDVTFDLTASDSLYFLTYHGEGFALYQYNNENYVIDEADFQDRAVFAEGDDSPTDLWLRLPSANGGTGWVLYDDAVKTEGIIISGIEGYGIANDLPDPASLSLDGVAFHSGSAELTEDSKSILDELAFKLLNVGDEKYEIAGYTDSSGASASNLALSQKRAEAVYDYLIDRHNINESMLVPVGYGEANPIADNATPEGRTKNRRVELNLQE